MFLVKVYFDPLCCDFDLSTVKNVFPKTHTKVAEDPLAAIFKVPSSRGPAAASSGKPREVIAASLLVQQFQEHLLNKTPILVDMLYLDKKKKELKVGACLFVEFFFTRLSLQILHAYTDFLCESQDH